MGDPVTRTGRVCFHVRAVRQRPGAFYRTPRPYLKGSMARYDAWRERSRYINIYCLRCGVNIRQHSGDLVV